LLREKDREKDSKISPLKVHLNKIFKQVLARSHDDGKSLAVKNVRVASNIPQKELTLPLGRAMKLEVVSFITCKRTGF
jgi:hypothetical protein